MKVALIPFYKNQLKNRIFSHEKSRDNSLFPYFNLKNKLAKRGVDINTIDITPSEKADIVIFLTLDISSIIRCFINNKLKNSIYIQFEPPVVEQLNNSKNLKWISKIFKAVLTWQDSLVDNRKFYKFFVPQPPPTIKLNHKKIQFNQKKFITTIISYKSSKRPNQLYGERKLAIAYFQEKYDNFLFYGHGWNKLNYKSYKGKVDSKIDTLKNFKYTICYENEKNINGLISEKIFDCFYANTVPIFLGAENICHQIPEELFIDKRNFKTYEELDLYISNISETDYNHRINLIENYLNSENFKKFECDNFADTIFNVLLTKNNNERKMVKSLILLKLLVYKITSRILNYIDVR